MLLRSDRAKEVVAWLKTIFEANGNKWPEPTITVATWHWSKGKEAPVVVLDPSLPKPCGEALSERGEMADTEHRCAYVAVTRARHTCLIVQPHPQAMYAYPFPREVSP